MRLHLQLTAGLVWAHSSFWGSWLRGKEQPGTAGVGRGPKEPEQPVSAIWTPPLPIPGPEGVPAPRVSESRSTPRTNLHTALCPGTGSHRRHRLRAGTGMGLYSCPSAVLVAFGCVWVSSAGQAQKQHLARSSHLPPVQFLGWCLGEVGFWEENLILSVSLCVAWISLSGLLVAKPVEGSRRGQVGAGMTRPAG